MYKNFKKCISLGCLLFVFQLNAVHGQIAKGLYIGYQAASIPGGMNNLRAMVGAENIRYQSLSKEMQYANLLHGISAGWIIRSKKPLFDNGVFMEINWNNLHNSFTAKGTDDKSMAYTSRYKVRMNSLGFLVGFPIKDKYVFKTGIQGSNFDIFYKGAIDSEFEKKDYKVVTDPEGFPIPYFHFGLDMPIQSGIYLRTYLNLSIDLAKELGYLYNVNHYGLQLFIPVKRTP